MNTLLFVVATICVFGRTDSVVWRAAFSCNWTEIGSTANERPFPQNGGTNWQQQITKQEIENADVSVLFIGNSHAAPIPPLLNKIFGNRLPKIRVLIAAAPSWGFLAQHANRQSTISLIKKGPWDYVVLQAQKYSARFKTCRSK